MSIIGDRRHARISVRCLTPFGMTTHLPKALGNERSSQLSV